MTYDQFWNEDCELVKFYRKAAQIRQDLKNQDAWLQGAYFYEALVDAAPILRAFAKKGTKPIPYREEPFDLFSKQDKGVLWGWTGDKSKAYGGAKYAVNGVPDIGADTMITKCKDASYSGWDKVDPGEVVWTDGHIGVYIGNGLAVECTPRWKNCVQITAVGNIGSKAGYNTRNWKKHGHLPYVTYDTTVIAPIQPETVKPEPVTSVKATGIAKSFNKSVAGKYTVTATSLNVRDAAGVGNKVLVAIPKGTVVQNYGYYTVVDGVKWLYVQFTYKRVTYTGFCSSAYLKK